MSTSRAVPPTVSQLKKVKWKLAVAVERLASICENVNSSNCKNKNQLFGHSSPCFGQT